MNTWQFYCSGMIKLMILEESLHPKSHSNFSRSNLLNRLKSESVTDCFEHELNKIKKKTVKEKKDNPWLESWK